MLRHTCPTGRVRWAVVLLAGLPVTTIAQADLRIARESLEPAAEQRAGDFVLRGTAGQPAVGTAAADGIRLQGGFHRAAGDAAAIFEDGFEARGAPASTGHDHQPEDPT